MLAVSYQLSVTSSKGHSGELVESLFELATGN